MHTIIAEHLCARQNLLIASNAAYMYVCINYYMCVCVCVCVVLSCLGMLITVQGKAHIQKAPVVLVLVDAIFEICGVPCKINLSNSFTKADFSRVCVASVYEQ